jgi:hypothetical protein
MHIPITTRTFVRKASSGIVVLCEFLGVQIAWFPNLWFISPALLFIWCLIQVTISIFLLFFVVEVGYHRRGEFTYIANIVMACLFIFVPTRDVW